MHDLREETKKTEAGAVAATPECSEGEILTSTTEDGKVFKNNARITIPQQLRDFPGARFILIDKKRGEGKKPKETGWQIDKNYEWNAPALDGYIYGGGNYGIATGFGWLCCFDADEYERLLELGVIAKLPKTFTVRTGRTSSEGRHYWYKIVGIKNKIVFFDTVLRDPKDATQFLHLGEIQTAGFFAIGPNCIHKSGKKYEVIDESPIAEITVEQLSEITKGLGTTKKEKKRIEGSIKIDHEDYDIDISLIAEPRGNVEKLKGSSGGVEYRGKSPFHDSEHGKNFSINPSKGVWCCYRCNSGGGWKELLAVEMGLISCAQAGNTRLNSEQYKKIYDEARRRGLIREKIIDAPFEELELETKKYVDELQPILPKGDLELWIGSPRAGKSYISAKLLINTGEGNYFAPNHEIVRHVLRDATKMGIKKCVHLEGKHQRGMCRKGENERLQCKQCIMFPNQQREEGEIGETWASMKRKANNLLKQKNILTKEEVPHDMCPYYTLKFAEEFANYCFTVINNINSTGMGTERNRKLTVIDEDTCMNFFYPQSVEIAKITRAHGKLHITTPLDNMDISARILELQENGGKKRLVKYANKIDEIKKMLAGLDGSEVEANDIKDITMDLMANWKPTIINLDDEEYGNDEDVKFGDIVKCMMYPYNEMRVMIKTKGVVSKLYLLADEKHATINMDWIDKTEKTVIIGAARAEMFVNERGGMVKEVKKFRFEDNFVVLVVDDEETDARGKKGRIRKKMIGIIKELSGSAEANTMRSMMVLTGSKDEQDAAEMMIGNGTFKCTEEGEEALHRVCISGLTATFYANSKISRGQDVDEFNVMFALGTDFAQPFMSEIDAEMARKITIDEITNSVLRISPTRKRGDELAKLIVIPKGEEWKIKYLGGRIIETKESATKIANVIKAMKIASESEKGNGELKISNEGCNKHEIYEKLHNAMMNANEYVDEKQLKTTMALIMGIIKSESSKWWTKREIENKLKTGGRLFDAAIESIAFSREAQVRNGSSGKVRIKSKKSASNDLDTR